MSSNPRWLPLAMVAFASVDAFAEDELRPVGAARVDVTPEQTIRLSGYGNRRTESEGVEQRLYARALAIGSDPENTVVILAVDNCGVPLTVTDEVRRRLGPPGLAPHSVVVASTHTHTGPMLSGVLPNLFGMPIPDDQQQRIDRYTERLTDALEQAAFSALADRKPRRVSFARGTATFARNRRRVAGGNYQGFGVAEEAPVDHDLPCLFVHEPDGKLVASVLSYACHCTTLGGGFNRMCGDWAGYAAQFIEENHTGATALVLIGCGADQNPVRGGPDPLGLAKQHGRSLADEVQRLVPLAAPVEGDLHAEEVRVELPFAEHRSRDEWQQRAREATAIGHHARVQLARLDRGEKLATHLTYPVQSFVFGDDLAMVFLAGEVVVDYSLALKRSFDPRRIWVSAYCNDVPCYIPSQRILAEGGYEAEGAMVYYDRPGRFQPEVEPIILEAVRSLVPARFANRAARTGGIPPRTPEESLAAIRVVDGFEVELVAAEPEVIDPVAIDFGADGCLWVVEMCDYPSGLQGNFEPGGRVRRLRDRDGDGRFEHSTVFLDGLSFPTGVMEWRDGLLVCAAPEVIFARDTSGDGVADQTTPMLRGFATHNYQARVNSLSLGLDGWVYGANGLFGGEIENIGAREKLDIGGRDFRLEPDRGLFQPATGLSQFGRVRSDFGDWFGNDNSNLLWHYPIADHYLARNPHAVAPQSRVAASGADSTTIYAISSTLTRFNQPAQTRGVTSACGPTLFRDITLGQHISGDAFVCEPVHNVVHHIALRPEGETFRGQRAPSEETREFLASTDHWFRPVNLRTGPDGALWVVDMYRFVIEHPRWISAHSLAQLDVRAGSDRGRIYRVRPRDKSLRQIADLRSLNTGDLAKHMISANGTVRDSVQRLLLHRRDVGCEPILREIATASHPAARLQALWTLALLGRLQPAELQAALTDASEDLRAGAVQLLGEARALHDDLAETFLSLSWDPSARVRFHTALALGQWQDPRAGTALGRIAVQSADNPWFRAAVVSSSSHHSAAVLGALLDKDVSEHELISPLIATAASNDDPQELLKVLGAVMPGSDSDSGISAVQLETLTAVLEGLSRRGISLAQGEMKRRATRIADRLRNGWNEKWPEDQQRLVLALTAAVAEQPEQLDFLERFLEPTYASSLQRAALEGLTRTARPEVGTRLLAAWDRTTPGLRVAIIDRLLRRSAWSHALLDAAEQGTLSLDDLDAERRDRLRHHSDPEVAARAGRLLKATTASPTEKMQRYSRLGELQGDPFPGAAQFTRLCASCHHLRGQGHEVGPDLTALTDQSDLALLTAVLDPAAAVLDPYRSYAVRTTDGSVYSGRVVEETSTSFTLLRGGGESDRILRRDVQRMQASPVSLMPEDLADELTPQDLKNLFEYIRSVPRPLGSTTAEQAAAALKSFRATGLHGCASIVKSAEILDHVSWLGRLPMHHCRQNSGQSFVEWTTGPVPEDLAPGAVHTFRLAAAMGWTSQPAGGFSLSLDGNPVLEFPMTIDDARFQSDDGRVRMTYHVKERNAEDSVGVLTLEIQQSLLVRGKPATFRVTGSASGSQRWFGIFKLE